ncbi:MAG: phytanoyl-CoA dioxygenase family protein [Verrucomicrobiota bacterium]|jgi:ectoine hydroxylase-related dioxygenase (phytanoyl-CoA dioxygenase family)|nr:phytanoyl-CoA dioxygenase family protein [Verrucomicrobiota bacterium]
MLSEEQISQYQADGHLTVPGVFSSQQMDLAFAEIETWGGEFRAQMNAEERSWYLENPEEPDSPLRKLDNPVFHRDYFQELAKCPVLVEAVEQLIGKGVGVFFSQVFCKSSSGGGPKPVHQDNFYFDPDDPDALVTAWIAFDEATVENGCLHYADGSQKESLLEHVTPENEPFNLQIPQSTAANYPMNPAPVPSGGVSFHHGNILHQSSSNLSSKPRRAAAFHYFRNDARLVKPALPFDASYFVTVS